jgi:LAO/AO transport system kinase
MDTHLEKLASQIEGGNVRALAKGISLVESQSPGAIELVKALYHHTGRAHVVGLTGPPGAGKSTLVGKLATRLRGGAKSVAILAVDPSSPFTGGAVLGDRVRMHTALSDPSIFVRSLASRGHLGGVSLTTDNVLVLLDAAGFDFVLIETVGAGQSEIEVMDLVHTVGVVLAPGMGDEIQAIKAGILEIGDILVLNKADRADAVQAVRQLRSIVSFVHMGKEGLNRWPEQAADAHTKASSAATRVSPSHARPLFREEHFGHADLADMIGVSASSLGAPGNRFGSPQPGGVSWRPPIVKTVATGEEGLVDLANRITEHRVFLAETGQWEARKKLGVIAKFEARVRVEATRALLGRADAAGLLLQLLPQLLAKLQDYSLDPYTAADLFVRAILAERAPAEQS